MTKHEDTTQAAGGSPVERGVGRLEPERDQDGPRGTYGCACKSRDAAECHRRRYGIVAGDVSHGAEECDCLCHHWSDDDDEPDEPVCQHCHGDGMDPMTDYLLPCWVCQREQRP